MKNAVLIVLAFAFGGGAVWYFMRDDGAPAMASSARPAAFPAPPGGPGGRPGAGAPAGAGGFGQAQQLPLVAVAAVKRASIYDVIEALGTAQAKNPSRSPRRSQHGARVNFTDSVRQAGAALLVSTNQRRGVARRSAGGHARRRRKSAATWQASRQRLGPARFDLASRARRRSKRGSTRSSPV
jgi:hypothetical protein